MFYDFEGLRAYKAKLRPEQWTPLYLSYPASQGMWISVLDVLSAFARGGLVRFALRSLRHGAPAVLRGLVVLLVPWTLLLALVPGERWFGAEWIRWAWVGFDVLLLVLLVRALRVPSTRLLTLLTAVVALDALVTTMQAMLWNLPRAHGVLDLGVMLVACAGPALAAAALWGVRRNRLRRG